MPFKAIAEEKFAEFRERYGDLGVSVVISDGDHTSYDREIRRGNFGIAVIVYEKMFQLLIQSPGILADCSLIVVDEVQSIADQTRGPSLEMLLTHFRRISQKPQMIGLSATISDLGGLDSWLDADVIHCSKRPVPLWEGVASQNGSSDLENTETNEHTKGPDLASVRVPKSISSSNTKLDIAYRILSAEGLAKQFLIFRTRVDDTVATARDLAYVLPADPVSSEIRIRIDNLEDTRARSFLDQWIDKRVAYHNAGLALEERSLIERLFREGVIRVLVTTSTLAAGVNTPADTSIVLDHNRYDFTKRSSVAIPITDYRNSVGRAGRLGITSEGHSYLVTDNPKEVHKLRDNYIFGMADPIRSSIPNSGDPGILVLRLLSLGLIGSQSNLRDAIRHSFAYNHYFSGEMERDDFLADFSESLGDLQERGLVESNPDGLSVTDIGRVASSSGMSLHSFFTLIEILNDPSVNKRNVSEVLSVICQLREFQSMRPYDSGDKENALRAWIGGIHVSQIIEEHSDRYEIGYGHIQNLGETAAWMLNTASRIASVPGVCSDDEEIPQMLEDMAKRCKYGVPGDLTSLAELKILRRMELNLLLNNSTGKVLDTPHKVLDAQLEDFVGILSTQRARALQLAILDRIGESLSASKSEYIARAERFDGLRPLVEMCYDQDGVDFERAMEQLLNSEFLNLRTHRFGRQRKGQADLEVTGENGTIVIQVTASEDNKKPTNWDKAREVMSSIGYSGQASNFVTIARPGFHEVAVGNATEVADRGDQRLLLLPLPELMEICLSEIEGTIPSGTLLRVLEDARGHYIADEQLD